MNMWLPVDPILYIEFLIWISAVGLLENFIQALI